MRLIITTIYAILLLGIIVTPLIAEAVTIEDPLKKEPGEIITDITKTLRELAMIVGGIMIMISGLQYMLSGGNEERAGKAKKTMLYTVIGVAIIVASTFIIDIVKEILGAE